VKEHVLKNRPLVLVAGIGRSRFDELAPVLDRQKLEIVQVTSAEDSAKLAHSDPLDLVILDSEPTTMSLEKIVSTIRSRSSASCNASILVLARPGRSDEARALIGRGVNQVMLAGDPPELIGQRVAELLHIAPRTTLRFSTRLLAEVADGADEALGAVVNISTSGMLVETDTEFEPGQHVVISIDVAGQDEPLAVKAEVVRSADPARDGVEGIGVRFLAFAGDGRKRLDDVLDQAFRTRSS
jgi:hypothetical protein